MKPSAEDVNTKTESKENIIEIEIPFPLFQYLSSDACNLQNICRICLSFNEPVLVPLFSGDGQSVLATMVMAISEVQMSIEDCLPSNICPRCQAAVMNYYEFKMKCVNSDYTLKSVLKGEFVIEEKSIHSNILNNTEIKTELEAVDDLAEPNKEKDSGLGIDYLENLKESMSDDETLCVVQDTLNNQKKITILDKVPKNFMKNVYKSNISKKKVKHQCTFCLKKFKKAQTLKDHINMRHPDSESLAMYPCTDCKEAFESEFDLKVHGILHNQHSGWKCTECKKEFNGRTALRRHIERHMRRRRFVCDECGAEFVEKYALRRHLVVHTPHSFEKKHACIKCDKRFRWRSALMAHMSTHTTTRDCICGVCGLAFASRRLLASHERVHSSDKQYACTYCDRRFRHESTRNTHLRTHTGERPYVCAQCGKAFIQNSNLTLHMRTHTGERPYSCTFCERKFSSSSTLAAHKRTHTGEKPYSCNICGKSFVRINMKNHMRMHSGELPHACPAPSCGKRFLTAQRLRDHYRLHTGEKPFECANCTKKFATKSQLVKHFKRYKKEKKAGKEGAMLLPVKVHISDNNIQSTTKPRTENTSSNCMLVASNEETDAPVMHEANLCTIEEIPMQPTEGLIYQDDTDIKTEVIVLDSNPNLVDPLYVNDANYSNNDVNLVTVNEDEVSISAASASVDGTSVKLYQYDQSLVQIHTGGGQLTISRISSKMTTNF